MANNRVWRFFVPRSRVWSGAFVALAALLASVTLGAGPAAATPAHSMKVDFTGVSATQYWLYQTSPNGWTNSRYDNVGVQTFTMPEGGYEFVVGSGLLMSCDFSVTAAGAWSYDPSCAGFVAGAGTDTLTVTGYPITLDPSSLSLTRLDFAEFYASGHLDAVPKTFNLVPTRSDYLMLPGSGLVSSCGFGVGLDGKVTLAPASEPCLSGAGTTTVDFQGFTVSLDARQLSTGGFTVSSFSGIRSSGVVQNLTLLPLAVGSYQFGATKAGLTDFLWNIDSTGNVTFPTTADAYASGRGTTALTLVGVPVNVDATNLGPGNFDIKQYIGPTFDQTAVESLRLVPGNYYFSSGSGAVAFFVWSASVNGTVDYVGSPTPCVSGRSTTTLVVGCSSSLIETTNLAQGGAPFAVTFIYTETNVGFAPISNATVSGSICGAATLQSGDTNNNGLLDRGETWIFTCTHTFGAPGSYTDTGTANGTNAVSNLALPPATASATVQATTATSALSPGFWKNHPSATKALLPQTLGGDTITGLSAAAAIFGSMNCGSSSSQGAVGCLAGQLLAAQLNVSNGASNACIAGVIQQANALLTSIGYSGPGGSYPLSASQRASAVSLAGTLANYNVGSC